MRATSATGIGLADSRTGRPPAKAACGIDITAFGARPFTNVWLYTACLTYTVSYTFVMFTFVTRVL
jgi:hypothetical protein